MPIEPVEARQLDRAAARRLQARTAAGATLTGMGLGLGGLVGLTPGLHGQQPPAARPAQHGPDRLTPPRAGPAPITHPPPPAGSVVL